MSDGGKSGLAQVIGDIGEAIIEPMKDEVGKAVEQGQQSMFNPTVKPTDPAEAALKKQEETLKIAEAQRKIKFWRDLEEAQKKVREEEKRKQMIRLQGDNQKGEEQKIKQFQLVQRKQEDIALKNAKTKAETKKGVGG